MTIDSLPQPKNSVNYNQDKKRAIPIFHIFSPVLCRKTLYLFIVVLLAHFRFALQVVSQNTVFMSISSPKVCGRVKKGMV